MIQIFSRSKNAIIVTALADRNLAIKDILQSAFSHSGQKCSSASLVILEKEVYDDPHFLHLLKESAKSLKRFPLPQGMQKKLLFKLSYCELR